MNIQIKVLRKGAENTAKRSGQSFAIFWGEISPKISTTTVTTTVDTVAPISPQRRTNNTVPKEAVAIFTILFPIRIVKISLSYCSESLHARIALRLPFSAKVFSLVRFSDENAVSVAENRRRKEPLPP